MCMCSFLTLTQCLNVGEIQLRAVRRVVVILAKMWSSTIHAESRSVMPNQQLTSMHMYSMHRHNRQGEYYIK